MTYTSFAFRRSLFFTAAVAVGVLGSTACGGDTSGGADAGRDTGSSRVDAFVPGEMDALCLVDCAAPPPGCRWEPVAGECSCGTLVCEDAGTVAGEDTGTAADPDAPIPPGVDADLRTDAYVPPGTDAGASCGPDSVCPDRQWCASDVCGGSGFCTTRPSACPRVYAPVCGCDGNTYDNSCLANAAGQNVASEGECPAFPDCRVNAECSRGQWCAGSGCDTPGSCEAIPTRCPDLYAPVCGCDGMTYGNACEAAAAGARVASDGECSSTGGMCTPPCSAGQSCQLCRGPGGGVYVCLPRGAMC